MELGIIGLPTSGKTTIFNALTRGNHPTGPATTGKMEIHSAVVDVPDERVGRLNEMFQRDKTIHAKVTYTDVAGLEGMGKRGLSGQLRNHIATLDALIHVVRTFESAVVPHPLGSVAPQRDLEMFHGEMILADLLAAENRLERIAEGLRKGARGDERKSLQEQQSFFQRLCTALESEIPLRDLDLMSKEKETLHGFGLLSLKPTLVLLNTGEDPLDPAKVLHYEHRQTELLSLSGKLEMEIGQLALDEVELFMQEFGIQELGLNRVIQTSYALLGLQSFFTVGEDEVRAWTVREGATALDAAGTVHTDLARGFIRAEVIAYDELMAIGSLTAARKMGKLRLEGKKYVVQDGDILRIRFSI
ncbi:MAG: redox-regulated ATPase YchF [Chloroflexota bacterium]|nr:redox-regulated ATPase YchF [Chloroflexota bacterium]